MQLLGPIVIERMDDECYFIGIRAKCQVVINGVIQTLYSGGLWGIELDSGKDYLKLVEDEQTLELQAILAELELESSLPA